VANGMLATDNSTNVSWTFSPYLGRGQTVISNTALEVTLFEYAVPTNLLGSIGQSVRWDCGGVILNNTGSAATLTYRIYLDNVEVLEYTGGVTLATSANRRALEWTGNAWYVGATSAEITSRTAVSAGSPATGIGGTAPNYDVVVAAESVTAAWATGSTLKLTVTPSAQSANLWMRAYWRLYR
jgi:hypothetical protein